MNEFAAELDQATNAERDHKIKYKPGIGALLIVLSLHFLFLAFFFAPAISTPDANGYLAQARLIAKDVRTDIEVESPAQYVGDHWMLAEEGRYYGQYPPGLPAMLALVFKTKGAYASLWVIPVMGTLSLLALYLTVREWVSPGWAIFATVLMAVNPFANSHALGADSHTAVCFFLTWALYGLVRWQKTRFPGWAALVGFCLGVIPSIRYPETLFAVPFAIYVAVNLRRDAKDMAAVALGIASALVPIAALAIRNQNAFGAFWKTGYSISGEQTGFGIGYFLMHFVPYIVLLLAMGVGMTFIIGLKGLKDLCKDPETKQRGLLLVGLILPITLLYMAYYWHADPHSLRFLLPTFFPYTIAAVWYLQRRELTDPAWSKKWSKRLLAFTLIWGTSISVVFLNRLKQDNSTLASVTATVEQNVEPGSIFIAQNGIQQHLDFVGEWKLASEEAFDRQARPDRPMGPENMGGPGRRRGGQDTIPAEQRTKDFRIALASWAGEGRKIFWLTTPSRVEEIKKRLDSDDEMITVAEVTVAPGRRGPGGPGAGPGGPEPDRVGGPPGEAPESGGNSRTPGADSSSAGPPPRRGWRSWIGLGGPPPLPPGGDGPGGRGAGGPPGGPAHFNPPSDGKMVLIEWKIKSRTEKKTEG